MRYINRSTNNFEKKIDGNVLCKEGRDGWMSDDDDDDDDDDNVTFFVHLPVAGEAKCKSQ